MRRLNKRYRSLNRCSRLVSHVTRAFCISSSPAILSNSRDLPRWGIFRLVLKGDALLRLSFCLLSLKFGHAREEMRRIYCRHKVHPTEIASVPMFPTNGELDICCWPDRVSPAPSRYRPPHRAPLFTLYLLWLASPRSEANTINTGGFYLTG